MRGLSGKLVVLAVIVIAVGGAVLLNLTTGGPSKTLERIAGPTPSEGATPNGYVVVTARSEPADPGRTYPFDVTDRCGTVRAVDFDAAFWDPVGVPALRDLLPSLQQPVEPATITLETSVTASIQTAAGQNIALVRHPQTELAIPPCP